MNVLDIVLVCFLVLVALIGCFKGFFSTLLSFVGTTLSFVGAFFLAKPLAGLINKLFGISSLQEFITNSLKTFFTQFTGELTGTEILANNCSAQGLLKSAFKLLVNPETKYTHESFISTLGLSASAFILTAICMVVSVIAIKIIIFILAKLFDSAKKNNKALNGTDKFIGLIFGVCKGLLIISIVCVIANLLQTIPAVASALDTVFDKSNVGKPIYDFVTGIASKYLYNLDIASLLAYIK